MKHQLIASLFVIALTCPAFSADESDAMARAAAAVVRVYNAEGTGSGVVVSSSGMILTNAHVVLSPLPFEVAIEGLGEGGKTLIYKRADVCGYHPDYDLAIIRINTDEHEGVALKYVGMNTKAAKDDAIAAIGYPVIDDKPIPDKRLTTGKINDDQELVSGLRYVRFDARVDPGNSGGGLFDKDGNVVGIVTFKIINGKEDISYAVPASKFFKNGAGFESEFIPLNKRGVATADQHREFNELNEYGKRAVAFAQFQGAKGEGARIGFAAAIRAYHIAIVLKPNETSIYRNLGYIWSRADEHMLAAGYFMQAINIEPWHAVDTYFDYNELGDALMRAKRPDDARTAWLEGLHKFPDDTHGSLAAMRLGAHDLEQRNFAQALYHSELAIKLDPVPKFREYAVAAKKTASENLSKEQIATEINRASDDHVKLKETAKALKKLAKPHVLPAFTALKKKLDFNFGREGSELCRCGQATDRLTVTIDAAEKAWESKDHKKAIQTLDEAIAKSAGAHNLGDAKTLVAAWRAKLPMMEEAYIKTEITVLQAKAKALLREGKKKEALAMLEPLVKKYPDREDVKKTIAPQITKWAKELNDPNKAIIEGDIKATMIYMRSKQYAIAIRLLDKIIDKYPDHPSTEKARALKKKAESASD